MEGGKPQLDWNLVDCSQQNADEGERRARATDPSDTRETKGNDAAPMAINGQRLVQLKARLHTLRGLTVKAAEVVLVWRQRPLANLEDSARDNFAIPNQTPPGSCLPARIGISSRNTHFPGSEVSAGADRRACEGRRQQATPAIGWQALQRDRAKSRFGVAARRRPFFDIWRLFVRVIGVSPRLASASRRACNASARACAAPCFRTENCRFLTTPGRGLHVACQKICVTTIRWTPM
jgi:hypothetical protein